MSLDVRNPWQAHAYFALGFRCEDCDRQLSVPAGDDEETSDPWCVALARLAFAEGWFVPAVGRAGQMDVMSAWCPDCGPRRRMVRLPYVRVTPT